MCSSVWFNPHISNNKLYFSDWYKSGISVVDDIINEEGILYSLDELRQRYNFNINF